MKFRPAFIGVSLIPTLVLAMEDAPAPAPAPPRAAQWRALANETSCTARHEAALTAMDGKLYLIGGRGIKPVEEYDPITNRWKKLAPPPIELHHFQAVAVDGKIAVVGAFTGRFPKEPPVPELWWFDPAANDWSKGPEISEARRRGSAGVVLADHKLYLVCGITNGHWNGFVPWLDVLDLKTGQWTELPDAPHARDHFQAAVVDGKIVAAGGRTSFGENKQVFGLTVPAVDVYEIATNQWTTMPAPIPTPRAGCMAVSRDRNVVILGGESGKQPDAHREVEAFSLETGGWQVLPSLLEGRHGTGAAFIGDTLYIAAGCAMRGGKPELDTMETLEWEKSTKLPFNAPRIR